MCSNFSSPLAFIYPVCSKVNCTLFFLLSNMILCIYSHSASCHFSKVMSSCVWDLVIEPIRNVVKTSPKSVTLSVYSSVKYFSYNLIRMLPFFQRRSREEKYDCRSNSQKSSEQGEGEKKKKTCHNLISTVVVGTSTQKHYNRIPGVVANKKAARFYSLETLGTHR